MVGRNPIVEALRAGRRLHQLLVSEGAHGTPVDDLLRMCAERSVMVKRVPRERLDAMADHNQGVIAEAAPYAYAELNDLLQAVRAAPADQPPIVLAVDALQDPQNFGSLLRTALAAGALGAILPERRSVGVTSAVGRASAGAIEHLRIVRVVNLVRALHALQAAGLWVVGLDPDAPISYDQADLTAPLVVVVGSEGSGLGRLVSETCDVVVRLPMVGTTESLNAAVAGSIVLYEAVRQRRRRAQASP